MTFRRMKDGIRTALAVLGFVAAGSAWAQDAENLGTAVVPTEVIYPGDVINASQLQELQVTNPNLTGDYAKKIKQVAGLVSKRTLLPGRTVSISALREPFAVTRGQNARLIMNMGVMTISAAGTPLEDGAVGDVIRARNLDSGIIVSGTVMQNGTIQVAVK